MTVIKRQFTLVRKLKISQRNISTIKIKKNLLANFWKSLKLKIQNVKKLLQKKPKPILKVGDRVRMLDGRSVGSIDSIEKNKATVNYGIFTSKVSLDELELVEAGKK